MDKGAVHQSEMPQVNGVDECRDWHVYVIIM
jgi:hypothetical protein